MPLGSNQHCVFARPLLQGTGTSRRLRIRLSLRHRLSLSLSLSRRRVLRLILRRMLSFSIGALLGVQVLSLS